jgi:hypothetical protein
LNLNSKKSKKRQDWQEYSHIYWDNKLKAMVAEEWATHKQAALEPAVAENAVQPTLPDTAPLPFCNEVVRRLFKVESPEIKAAVERYRNGLTNPDETREMDDKDLERKRVATAKNYHE